MSCWARALLASVCVWVVVVLGGCARVSSLREYSRWVAFRRAGSLNAASDPSVAALTIRDIQVKGSHNSYHRAPWLAVAQAWRYSHPPLEVQLGMQGVRQLELDLRYEQGQLVVGHLPLLDGRSNCKTFYDCLSRLKRFSRAHPSHTPVFVFIEPKEGLSPSNLDGKLDAIDGEISRVFSRSSLIVPSDVAGDASSLREAVATRGWPSLSASRGRFAFVLFGPARHRRAYSAGRPRLEGRTMFVADTPGLPDAAVVMFDDPVPNQHRIANAVRAGLLVRTRADDHLLKDRGRRDAALASGAHFVGTDFVDPREGWLDLGSDSPVRCNPISAPATCSSKALASLERALGFYAYAPTARGR